MLIDLGQRRREKRDATRHEVIESHAQSPGVGRFAMESAHLATLGRQERRSASGVGNDVRVSSDLLADTKVAELEGAVLIDEHVLGLDVPVDDVPFVHELDSVYGVTKVAPGGVELQWFRSRGARPRRSLAHVLEHNVHHPGCLIGQRLVKLDDVLVLKLLQNSDFLEHVSECVAFAFNSYSPRHTLDSIQALVLVRHAQFHLAVRALSKGL
mmetsp:Transcript_32357/g.69911  ORF Transcript_32357/g.69911 Transcript_32357/m.69911 type:complete len:212 (+) Transcript_32357:702-1337(+)